MNYGSGSTAILEELSEGAELSPSAISTLQDARKKASTKSGHRPDARLSFCNLKERNRILIDHLPQVYYIARRIHDRLPQHVPLDDLVHSGVLGLMEALHNYDPSKNVQLKSYAKVRIQGAILDSLRELDWCPRTLRKKARQIECAHQTLRKRLGRAPADTEVAAEMGIGLKKFQQLLGDLHGLEVISLQAMGSDDGTRDDGTSYLAQTMTEDPSELCLRSEMNGLLARAVGELAPRKRQVLALYYLHDLTMKEVGARLGVGESRVSQIHSAVLVRLRVRMRQLLESRHRQKPTPLERFQEMTRETPRPEMDPEAVSLYRSVGRETSCNREDLLANLHMQYPARRPDPEGTDELYTDPPRSVPLQPAAPAPHLISGRIRSVSGNGGGQAREVVPVNLKSPESNAGRKTATRSYSGR